MSWRTAFGVLKNTDFKFIRPNKEIPNEGFHRAIEPFELKQVW